MKRTFLFISLVIMTALLVTSCRQASTGIGEVVIALAGPLELMDDSTGFLKGAQIALERCEKDYSSEGLSVKLQIEDDKGSFKDGLLIARKLVEDTRVTAVVGHWNSHITIPAADLYNDAGKVMLSPIVSSNSITEKGYSYVFRNTLSDSDMGKAMAEYASKNKLDRIAVYYLDNNYGRGLAKAFQDAASQMGIQVLDWTSGFNSQVELEKALEKWRVLEVNGLFVAHSMYYGAEDFISEFRKLDKTTPIFGGDAMDVATITDKLGKDIEGFVVPTIMSSGSSENAREFIAAYKEKYNEAPDVWALQGYDSVMLIADMAFRIKSNNPSYIANELRNLKDWEALTGKVCFDSSGNMTGLKIDYKVIKDGKFQPLNN